MTNIELILGKGLRFEKPNKTEEEALENYRKLDPPEEDILKRKEKEEKTIYENRGESQSTRS